MKELLGCEPNSKSCYFQAQDSLNPAYNNSSDAYCREEGMCAATIACCYSPPVFQSAFAELAFLALLWRDTGRNALVSQTIPEPVGIIVAVRQQVFLATGRSSGNVSAPL